MKNNNNNQEVFTGTVNQLLEHCSSIDLNMLEEQLKDQEKQDCLDVIMQELDCDEFEAQKIYDEIALNEVKTVVDGLVEDGIVEIIGHGEDGEPLFGLTELGKQLQKEIDEKNNS